MEKTCKVCKKIISNNKTYCSDECRKTIRTKYKANNIYSQKIRGLKRKIYFIEKAGGGCVNCGYNKNISCLHFHHKIPSEKSLRLDMRSMSNNSFDVLEQEFKKCDLLCSLCHSELHHPEMDLLIISETLNSYNENKVKLKTNKKENTYCVDCGIIIHNKSTRCQPCESINKTCKTKPLLEDLLEDLKTLTYTDAGKKYGVSRTTIKRWIK